MSIQEALDVARATMERSAERGSTVFSDEEHSAWGQILDMADVLAEEQGLDYDYSWWEFWYEEREK